jgi:hypothetical protein
LQLQDGVQFKVLGDSNGVENAKAVEPSLEDGYIWLMRSQKNRKP